MVELAWAAGQAFLDLVLSYYVRRRGRTRPDEADATTDLKYHDSIADAVAELGKQEGIGKVFSGFQEYLYQEQATAGSLSGRYPSAQSEGKAGGAIMPQLFA